MATIWWLLFWTAVGLCLGSFLNVVVYRIPRNQSLRAPLWSACPHCRKRIIWYDNIPVISFILLGGRCRECGVPIATRYLVIEVAMALITLCLQGAESPWTDALMLMGTMGYGVGHDMGAWAVPPILVFSVSSLAVQAGILLGIVALLFGGERHAGIAGND